jgi:predicted nucleic acid-binding Zn ribbon protein
LKASGVQFLGSGRYKSDSPKQKQNLGALLQTIKISQT